MAISVQVVKTYHLNAQSLEEVEEMTSAEIEQQGCLQSIDVDYIKSLDG